MRRDQGGAPRTVTASSTISGAVFGSVAIPDQNWPMSCPASQYSTARPMPRMTAASRMRRAISTPRPAKAWSTTRSMTSETPYSGTSAAR
ncbi:MAG TPA: hypothetical protein DEH11_18535 [Actinobacteria bacterium]|nr:hypothetical protein [Actinomycetota bacterium]